MIFMNVDLPDPLAPISPYRLPSPNLTLTFSKRGLGPNWMVRLAVDITVVANGATAPIFKLPPGTPGPALPCPERVRPQMKTPPSPATAGRRGRAADGDDQWWCSSSTRCARPFSVAMPTFWPIGKVALVATCP
ncbi:hypothetical protein G6F31_020607 [Rhizopus arrhizus]|nr:hypothetical protein G6F31_020607 [Rhizopus arrhizus]